MSVQLNQQTRSTRFAKGSLRDWYTWKCSKTTGQKQRKQMKHYFLSWQTSLINPGYLLISLPSLLPEDTPGKFQPFLKAGAILGSRVVPPIPLQLPPTPAAHPRSHDLLHGFAEIPLPLYFPHHSALPNMHICLLPMREGEPFLALRARFPAIHQSLKVYSRH